MSTQDTKNTGHFAMLNLVNAPKAYEILDMDKIMVTDKPKCVYFRLRRTCDIASVFYLYCDGNITDYVEKITFKILYGWTHEINLENISVFMQNPSLVIFPFKIALLAIPMMYELSGDMTVHFEVTLKQPYTDIDASFGMRYRAEYYNTRERKEMVESPEKYVGKIMDIVTYTTMDNLVNCMNNHVNKLIEIYDPTDDIFSVTFNTDSGISTTFTKHDSLVVQYTGNNPVKESMFVINPEFWSFHRFQLDTIVTKNKAGDLLDLSKYKVALTTMVVPLYAHGTLQIKA